MSDISKSMSHRNFAIIDPAAGISGDMLLGAIVAAGASEAWLASLPGRLGLSDVHIDVRWVDRAGLQASKVTVRLPGGEVEGPSVPEHDHYHQEPGGHSHPHLAPKAPQAAHDHSHAPHRHVGELLSLVERAPLSPWVKRLATRTFRVLGEAEGRVHGVPADQVALHEVGALDALIDIVGVIEGFEQLGLTEIYSRPVAVGNGWVRAAHGVLPVPAPATALLLEGLVIGPDGPVTGEATTPTGAALLRALSSGPPPPQWRSVRTGFGAGTRDPEGYANVLRLTIAEAVPEAGEVVVLVTDVDDLSPEYLEPLREALMAAGALDLQIWPTQMKKGRIGFRIEALVNREGEARVTEAIFKHSTTAGLRRWTAERTTLTRHEIHVSAAGGEPIRVKVLDGPTGPRSKPEYDDVVALAKRSGRPAHEIAKEVEAVANRLVRPEAAGHQIAYKESE